MAIQDITTSGRLLLYALYAMHDQEGEWGVSKRDLAGSTMLCQRTLRAQLKQLVDERLVEALQSTDKAGGSRPTLYRPTSAAPPFHLC